MLEEQHQEEKGTLHCDLAAVNILLTIQRCFGENGCN